MESDAPLLLAASPVEGEVAGFAIAVACKGIASPAEDAEAGEVAPTCSEYALRGE